MKKGSTFLPKIHRNVIFLHSLQAVEMYTYKMHKIVVFAATLLTPAAAVFSASAQTSQARVVAALENITALARPGQDGYATIWDGNKYVQCKRLADRSLQCESAGALMQSSLEHVLTPERIAQLAALGWRLDPSFGNYVQTFPAGAAPDAIADKIVQVLGQVYDANTAELEIQTAWIPSEPCPPRNGPSQNLAGMVNNAPAMRATAVYGCSYKPRPDLGPNLAMSSAADLIGFYGTRVTAEIQRLRINAHRRVGLSRAGSPGAKRERRFGETVAVACEPATKR